MIRIGSDNVYFRDKTETDIDDEFDNNNILLQIKKIISKYKFIIIIVTILIIIGITTLSFLTNNKVENYLVLLGESNITIYKDSDYIKTLMKVYREVTGDLESEPISSGGATYARAMENIVAFGPKLVSAPSTEHQPNEYIVIDNMKVAMEVYAETFLALVIS